MAVVVAKAESQNFFGECDWRSKTKRQSNKSVDAVCTRNNQQVSDNGNSQRAQQRHNKTNNKYCIIVLVIIIPSWSRTGVCLYFRPFYSLRPADVGHGNTVRRVYHSSIVQGPLPLPVNTRHTPEQHY